MNRIGYVCIMVFCALYISVEANIGQSSVIVMNFPWGARSTGLGETFTGIADTEEALFYNPAGLGQSPLANSWVRYDAGDHSYSHISSRGTAAWAVSEAGGIFRFVGTAWRDYLIHYVDSGETMEDVARRYVKTDRSEHINSAVERIAEFNNLGSEKRNVLYSVLEEALSAEAPVIDSLIEVMLALPKEEQNETAVFAELAYYLDDDDLTTPEKIAEILQEEVEIQEKYSIDIPYDIGPRGTIYDIAADDNNRLWVATDSGLWLYSTGWEQYDVYDGLASDTILSLSFAPDSSLLIGTDQGANTYRDGNFRSIAEDLTALEQPVYSLTENSEGTRYFGLRDGLMELFEDGEFGIIDTADGLYDTRVTALFTDSNDRLWVGTEGGITRFDRDGSRRFSLGDGTRVYEFAQENENTIWVATNRGGSQIVEEYDDERQSSAYVINVYHENNSLKSSRVRGVTVSDNGDVWLSTDKSLEQYKKGQRRASMFFENLLPALGLDDLWHAAAAVTSPIGDWGSVGFFWNQLYFGEVESGVSGTGQAGGQEAAFEFETGVSYGFPVTRDLSFGLNLKYAFSRLEKDRAEARTIGIDAGLLKRDFLADDLDFGFVLKNMGPPVSYSEDEIANPIPFLARAGVNYTLLDKPGSRLMVALDADREIVYRDEEGGANFLQAIYYDLIRRDPEKSYTEKFKEIIWHGGVEYVYADFISFRSGLLYDDAGSRSELTFGVGADLNNIIADISIIVSTLGDDDQVRQNQTRFSITYQM
jgi:hypothetical protein